MEWKDLLCIFHLYRCIQKQSSKYLRKWNKKFLKDFSRIQRTETTKKFNQRRTKLFVEYTGEHPRLEEGDEYETAELSQDEISLKDSDFSKEYSERTEHDLSDEANLSNEDDSSETAGIV